MGFPFTESPKALGSSSSCNRESLRIPHSGPLVGTVMDHRNDGRERVWNCRPSHSLGEPRRSRRAASGWRLCTAALLAVFLASNGIAQVESAGSPASLAHALPQGIPTVSLPVPDRAAFEAEAARLDRSFGGYRYGAPIATSVDSSSDGRWDVVASTGASVWRVRIDSPGARSLGVLFDRFDLPRGGAVYLYGDDGGEVLGAYTERNEKPNGMLAIRPLAGDAVTVECVVPVGAGSVDLRVGEVIHDFRGILDPGHLSGASGPFDAGCRVDINCSVGAPYQRIKRACVMAMANGVVCSASIVNNTAEDGTPYMLTAEHCPSYTNGVIVFNYEKTGCGVGASSMAETVSGATLLASSPLLDPVLGAGADAKLYRMNATIPASYEPVFAGWDWSGNPPVGPSAMIGHAFGEPRQVAVDDDGAEFVTIGFIPVNYWRTVWTIGQTMGGNSGGPLLDEELRVIGTTCCVDTHLCQIQRTLFGRLRDFWLTGHVAQFLDPLGTGAVVLDAYDPFGVGAAYCSPGVSGATLHAVGSTSVAANDLTLRALEVSPSQFGLMFYGNAQAQSPLGSGTLCVGGSIQRLNRAIQTPLNGMLERRIDLASPPSSGGQITAGSTWYFQAWFRTSAGFDLSDAVQISFVP